MFKKFMQLRYEIIAFSTGGAVMILEIVGARLIAPYFGTSTYVWTAMIGVILGSLAIGYSLGGRLADKDNARSSLGAIIVFAAALVLVLGLLQAPILAWLSELGLDLRLGAFLAASLLFAAPSIFIGMVSPHLAKIRITSLETSGKSVGRLEAAGALGSIAGTFLCGYFLLGAFGSRAIVLGVVILLLLTSLLAGWNSFKHIRLGIAIVTLLYGFAGIGATSTTVLADVDTRYARYRVLQLPYNGEPITALSSDNRGIQSGVSVENPEKLVFSYIQQFDTTLSQFPNAQSILVIGGGTFTFPAAAAREHPRLQVDAVEIDPALTSLARQYFNLHDYKNLSIINEDGRTYLNRTTKQYDLIFLDAYQSLSPPFQLTTVEALHQAKSHLRPGGVLVGNVIGKSGAYFDPYLQAMQATTGAVFTSTALYPADTLTGTSDSIRNYILFASQSDSALVKASEASGTQPSSRNPSGQILRDDYAPIEQLIH